MKFTNPMRPRVEEVVVEYTSRGARVTKTFDCPFAARRFFMAKMRAGAEPTISRATVVRG